jgi:ubiquinone biosynthesis protein
MDLYYPPAGGAPPPPPLPEIEIVEHRTWLGYGAVAMLSAAVAALAILLIF